MCLCVCLDLEGFFFFFFESPNRQSQAEKGVCEGIHHNIACPRACFSHTRITEIALTVAHTVTHTCLSVIYTNTQTPALLVQPSDTHMHVSRLLDGFLERWLQQESSGYSVQYSVAWWYFAERSSPVQTQAIDISLESPSSTAAAGQQPVLAEAGLKRDRGWSVEWEKQV